MTDAEVAMGRVAPSLSMPGEIGILSGVSSFSLAVAEWVLDPRQVRTFLTVDRINNSGTNDYLHASQGLWGACKVHKSQALIVINRFTWAERPVTTRTLLLFVG